MKWGACEDLSFCPYAGKEYISVILRKMLTIFYSDKDLYVLSRTVLQIRQLWVPFRTLRNGHLFAPTSEHYEESPVSIRNIAPLFYVLFFLSVAQWLRYEHPKKSTISILVERIQLQIRCFYDYLSFVWCRDVTPEQPPC